MSSGKAAGIGTLILLTTLMLRLATVLSDDVDPREDIMILSYILSGCETFYLDLVVNIKNKYYEYQGPSGFGLLFAVTDDQESACNKKRVGAGFLLLLLIVLIAGLVACTTYGIVKCFN
ncbi:MAG: hypothetical protein MHMPM18_004888 [Marteilia pararefringens]